MSQIPFESLPVVSEELGNFQGWVGRWAGVKAGGNLSGRPSGDSSEPERDTKPGL